MKIIIAYLVTSTLVAAWTFWHIHLKLDKFDWAYYKGRIWSALVLRTVFWPLMLLFEPVEMLRPKFGFRASAYGVDLANTTRLRTQFIESPPPCGSKITYRIKDDNDQTCNALFYFSASAVEAMALKLIDETDGVEGLHAAAKWVSLRDETVDAPTEVPSVLVNFDYICEGLINDEHGEVHCPACNKIYSSKELRRDSYLNGSWLVADFKCPAQHVLLSREVVHFMFKRNYD